MEEHSQHIALVGQPNSGKTTLFNWLTGFKNRVINYPGSTVFISSGNLHKKYKLPITLIDTPGAYSLFPKSTDEEVTRDYLFNNENLKAVILILDGSKLEIQLPLFFQLKEAGFKIIVALTMWDLISKDSLDIDQLQKSLGVPVVLINGLIGGGVCELVEQLPPLLNSKSSLVQNLKPWSVKELNKAVEKSKDIYSSISTKVRQKRANLFISQKFDKFFLHPKGGLVLFGAIMFALFSSLFWLADPFMGYVDSAFSFLIDKTYNFNPTSLIIDFLANGILASFGAVLVFVPQIFILFLGISLLEDTGYLARAVALADGPLSKIGLSGRSFIPFLSGYACAIPAVMAARNLPSPRERLMAFFAIPFMSCSARLPVYALLLSFLFYGQSSWKPGLVLSLIYVGSFLLGIISVSILNIFLKSDKQNRPFILDLPIYRRPIWIKTLQNAWKRTEHYIFKAGPAIFTVALIVWAITNFPRNMDWSEVEQIQNSYAGQIGRVIEPIFELMGVDWRVGVGLITAFAAREVFVPSLALVFNITNVSNETMTSSLIENMKVAVNSSGELIFSMASVIALIVFFMVSLQCVSTTAIIYKESRSLKLALTQLISLNILAYLLASLSYQGLSLIL